MNWIDVFAMLSSLVVSIYLLVLTRKKSIWAINLIALFFVIFGPVVIAVHMSLHSLEITFLAITNVLNGTFIYNFRFYSLLLMGVLIGYLSLKLLASGMYYVKTRENKQEIYKAAAWIALVSLPTVPITPFGWLPVAGCIFTVLASHWVHKKLKVSKVSKIKAFSFKRHAALYQ